MLVLSIKQPWAWLIVNGYKDIENRSWPTKVRGKFLVHAGKKFDGSWDDWEFDDIAQPEMMDMGGIVGMSEIIDCVTESKSEWFSGEYGFVLGRSRPLPFMPMRGMLGFFNAEYDKKLLEAA